MNEEFAAKQAPVEELTMPTTDLNPSPVAAQTEDWGMTNPLGTPSNEAKIDDGWRMPEPIFRVSDGFYPLKSGGNAASDEKTPTTFVPPKQSEPPDESLANLYAPPTEEDFSQQTMHNLSLSDLKIPAPDLASVAPNITAAAPQPNISQEYTVKNPAMPEAPSEKKARSETARLFFVALGVAAMLVFAGGFLALVYFLFFYKAAE